jgi:hypothetical protein
MTTLIVKSEFFITTTSSEKIIAKRGDVLKVTERGAEYYNIKKLNGINIFSTWIRKPWVLAHCETNNK